MPRTISQYREQLAADNDGVDPYADLTDQQFAARLHQKHYSDVPFADFAGRVGLQGNYAPAGPQSRPHTNPGNNSALTIDGRPNRTQMAMDQAIDLAQPSEALVLPREPKISGAFRSQEARDTDAAFERGLRRLPEVVPAAGIALERAGLGARRTAADAEVAGELAIAEQFESGQLQPTNPQGERRWMSSSELARDLASRAGPGASERAGEAELLTARLGRRERQAAAEAQALEPSDAGPIERAVRSGLTSALVTAPVVTAGALIPGAQVPALVALGGMTGAQRYGELRAAGISEGEAALSAGYLGLLEGLTEKIPMGAVAKNSPFMNRLAEFMVTDVLGENVNTMAQIADDYRLGLNENVTMADVKQALQDTTAATIVGAGATLTMAELTRQVLERANNLAAAREPSMEVPELTDVVEPPLLTDELATVDEQAAGEDIELEGDGEMLPGEIQVEDLPRGEDITLETDPVDEWRAEQEAIEDPELDQVSVEQPSETPPSIEPQAEPIELPGPRTMAQRRADREAKHQRVVSAVTPETRPMGVTYVAGEHGWHGVQVDGRPYAWYRSEETAREEVRAVRADIAAGNIQAAEVDAAIARELPRQRVDRLAHEAATSPKNELPEPSRAQVDAGNYKKGHLRVQGLDISIENPKGSMRRSKPGAAVTWERKMRDHYGYIRGTEDNTDEHVDVFVGPSPSAESVYVIDQVIDGKFDEPKVMMGYRSQEQAQKAYLRNYQDGWDGIGAITPLSVDDFKQWVRSSGPKRPLTWKPPRDERIDTNRDRLEYMAGRAGWQEIGGQAITQGDAVRADVVGRTKWLPKEPWFAEVQRAAPLPGNKTGMATAAAVAKALGGKKLTAAEDRHIRAMNDAIEADDAEEARLAQTLEKTPEELSDEEIASIEARLERLAKMLEQQDRRAAEEPALPTGPGIQSDVPLFERGKDKRTGDMFGLTPPAGSVTQKAKTKPATQGDLFGGAMDAQTALEKIRAEKERRRQQGQQSEEVGRPDDLFSQARQQVDVEEVAKPEPPKAPEPEPVVDAERTVTLKDHEELMQRLRQGEATLAEYKAGWAALLKSHPVWRAELEQLTKAELIKRGGVRASLSDKKDSLVRQAEEGMLSQYSLSAAMAIQFNRRNWFDSYVEAVGPLVEKATQETLDKFAAEYRERVAAHTARIQGIVDPKTLEDFRNFIRYQGEAKLSDDQLERYDELLADDSKQRLQRAKEQRERERSQVQSAGRTVGAKVIASKHTKHGYPIFVVQMEERVERDVYDKLNTAAKQLGGYYSSYRGGGAIPGFTFKDQGQAESFAKLLQTGDTQAASAAVQQRRDEFVDDKAQSTVERLRAMADRLEEAAQEKLNADRKTNTARRAGMAARAEGQARSDISLARTMRNIAAAIDAEQAKFLEGVRTKAQVDMLRTMLQTGRFYKPQAEDGEGMLEARIRLKRVE